MRLFGRTDWDAKLPALLSLLGLVALAARLQSEPSRREPVLPEHATSADEPRSIQLKRAAEPDRGREATAPTHIPLRGWMDIFWRVYQGISRHRILAVGGGVAFYWLL